jgi:hypothetical protein
MIIEYFSSLFGINLLASSAYLIHHLINVDCSFDPSNRFRKIACCHQQIWPAHLLRPYNVVFAYAFPSFSIFAYCRICFL